MFLITLKTNSATVNEKWTTARLSKSEMEVKLFHTQNYPSLLLEFDVIVLFNIFL